MLYMAGKTRIHIDNVDGLGSFLELEVVLDDSDTVESGQNIAENLLCLLGVQPADLIEGAYVDMLFVRNS
jgi:adenylate cyclase class IV